MVGNTDPARATAPSVNAAENIICIFASFSHNLHSQTFLCQQPQQSLLIDAVVVDAVAVVSAVSAVGGVVSPLLIGSRGRET